MGISKFNGVNIFGNRFAKCPGGIFNISMTVIGVASNALGGVYTASLWDSDLFGDVKLTEIANIRIPKKKGVFRKTHKFKLDCDALCNVRGPKGNSNENPANIYGYVVAGPLGLGASEYSQIINLKCKPDDDKSVPFLKAGGTIETEIGLIISVPANAVAADVDLILSRSFEWPETEFFAPAISPDITAIQIGTPDIAFEAPVTLAWPMTKRLRGVLEELDGTFVHYHSAEETWIPVENVGLGDDHAKFQIFTGGLYGYAPHAQHMVTEFQPRQPPDQP